MKHGAVKELIESCMGRRSKKNAVQEPQITNDDQISNIDQAMLNGLEAANRYQMNGSRPLLDVSDILQDSSSRVRLSLVYLDLSAIRHYSSAHVRLPRDEHGSHWAGFGTRLGHWE